MSTAAWPPDRVIIAPANQAEREAVRTAQRALRLAETGEMDEATRTKLRGIQQLFKLPVSGVLDRRTCEALDKLRPPSLRE
ncbi:peptidoglycan-binding domain-containing protein [Streptomyces sp. NPDC057235]|uniref:peptidoglycan-binding domain-containing protein n=1 Tax=Streptomyces sp. NPDC057235 TaxID=3346058 RepID=UPI00363834D6